ncbi:VOC family protein [Vibrio ishigakensis]|uniref:VOC family protein n=1 Tax=Vibrio ishigakensis TaxID=1481914 RepID=UPI0021C25B5F|nr:VOC family protein [Vibrio ishigakensis]
MIEPISSFPVFTVKDLDAANKFYTEELGFNAVFSGDWYLHMVSASGIQVGFLLPNQPTQPEIFQKVYSGDGVIFSLEVSDAEKAYGVAQARGLNIVFELKSEEWGQRHFCIEDPNGIHIDIVQSFEPSEEYQSDYVGD